VYTFTVRLPESLHHAARAVAEEDGVSLNHLVTTALAEKIAALKTVAYLEARAKEANESDWDDILSTVPNVEAEAHDQFPQVKAAG